MHPILENFIERPRSHKIAFWVISHGIILFLFWQYFYAAKGKELEKVQSKLESLTVQIATETRIVNNLEKYRREVTALNGLFEIAQKRLPERREIPNLLASVSSLAKDSGLDVTRFAPKADSLREYYAEVPVEVEMMGTFHKVATFFDEISRLSRVVNVRDISLQDPRGANDMAGVEVDVKGTIVTFRYLEPEERATTSEGTEDAKIEKAKRKKPGDTKGTGKKAIQ